MKSVKAKEMDEAQKNLNQELENIKKSIKIKDLIIDFSCVNLIDTMGYDAILQVFVLIEIV